MALTIGTGPFGERPAGHFDVKPPATPLLFWEPFPKRFRVVAAGKTLADSRNVIALPETGQIMRLCAPWSDVRSEFLEPGVILSEGQAGPMRSLSINTGSAVIEASAQSFVSPPQVAAALHEHVFFDLEKVDAWYLEDELGYAHPRDPYHRVDVHRSSRHVLVLVGQTLVAETSHPMVLFESSLAPRFYLPPDAVRTDFLVKSETVSRCPYKGDGQHWHVVVEGKQFTDAGWSLTTPLGDALMIPRWFGFYPEKLHIKVDGQALRN